MIRMLRYKGYQATIQFSQEDKVFHGKIIGIHDLVIFEGVSISALKKALKDSIEDYLEMRKMIS